VNPSLASALAVFLGGMMLAASVVVLFVRDLLSAIIITGMISLSASVLFLLMDATDVAITEASIGAVLATLIFLWGKGKMGGRE